MDEAVFIAGTRYRLRTVICLIGLAVALLILPRKLSHRIKPVWRDPRTALMLPAHPKTRSKVAATLYDAATLVHAQTPPVMTCSELQSHSAHTVAGKHLLSSLMIASLAFTCIHKANRKLVHYPLDVPFRCS